MRVPGTSKTVLVKKVINDKRENIYKMYKLGEYYQGTTQEDMYKFLGVIRKMMKKSPSARPTIEDSLKLLQSLRPKKQAI